MFDNLYCNKWIQGIRKINKWCMYSKTFSNIVLTCVNFKATLIHTLNNT